jgi:hypothetical protein
MANIPFHKRNANQNGIEISPHSSQYCHHKYNNQQMFIATVLTIAKLWKQLRYTTTDEWVEKFCIHTQWNII